MREENNSEMELNKMDFNNKRLSVHHVGGRGGGRTFPILNKFEKDIINVLYDADTDCVAQIREKNQHLKSELHVLPYCLGDACKSDCLININYDPFTSSFHDPNPDYNSYYYFCEDHDYIFSEVTRTMEKRHIQVVSMDHIFRSTDIAVPRPDFLSLDTQGSEYEILLGARETLESSVVALAVEAEFHPFYKGQKLFGDLVKLLSDQGFDFVRFLGIHEMSPFRSPVGLRGDGFQTFADALFFKRVDGVGSQEKNDSRRYLMLRKLAFIAIIFNQMEYGLKCLALSKDFASDSIAQELEGIACYRFLRELEEKIEGMPIVFPETFASKYTFKASKSRFEISANLCKTETINRKIRVIDSIKELLRQIPPVYLLLKQVKQMLYLLKKLNLFRKYSDIETVLIKYGLERQAEILIKNRLIQSQLCRKI